MIKTSQKIIRIGSSAGVTIPAKELKRLGITYGDTVKLTLEPTNVVDQHTLDVIAVAQKLIKRHKQALINLSQK